MIKSFCHLLAGQDFPSGLELAKLRITITVACLCCAGVSGRVIVRKGVAARPLREECSVSSRIVTLAEVAQPPALV